MTATTEKIDGAALENLTERRKFIAERLAYIQGRKKLLEKIITNQPEENLLEEDTQDDKNQAGSQEQELIHTDEVLIHNEVLVEEATKELKEENENAIVNKLTESGEESLDQIIENLTEELKEKNKELIEKNKEVLKDLKDKENRELATQIKTMAELKEMLDEALTKVRRGKTGPLWSKIINKFWNQKNKLLRTLTRATAISTTLATGVALQYHSPQEYYELYKNYSERHFEKDGKDDPIIVGMNDSYSKLANDSTNAERSTYDFLGEHKLDYKSGYYMTSVFDLSDKTPPRFKMINDRENYSDIDSAAGITTNLFKKFYNYGEFKPVLKGHTGLGAEKIADIPVVGYNLKTQTIKAGHYKEFNDDWMVSETYEIPLNFKLNADSTLNLVYHGQAMRMVPVSINENGKEIPFPIGVSVNKDAKTMEPRDCTHFGTLEGGKVIMVCGDKQLQVNGSFSDIFQVYTRLKKEYPGTPIQGFLLDNGSYNLPIWNKDKVITTKEIREHLLRNDDGGTALVLVNDETISPYEYKNTYKEFNHYTPNYTNDSITHKPAVNEKSVIVIHHTADYEDPDSIIKQFENPQSNTSSHVVIMKDGTRHLFNTDNSVLAHAGKSDFNNRNAVNYFSLGVEMEGNSVGGKQFTIAQLESLLEYLRPRIEKYGIKFDNITTHKIIRDNYLAKHPDSTQVPRKEDLDDAVWKQIQDLIQKKLYNKINTDTVTKKGKKLMATISYQDAYRSYKNKELALEQAGSFLKENGIKEEDLEEIYTMMS